MIHDLNLSQEPTRRHADPSQVGTRGLRCCLLRRHIFSISYGSSYFLLLPSFLIRFSLFFVLLSWLKTRSSSRNHRKGTTGEGAGGGIGVWPYHFFILSLISCDLFSPPIALCVCVLSCCIVGAQPYIWWHTCEYHLTDRCHKLSCCTFHCQCSYLFWCFVKRSGDRMSRAKTFRRAGVTQTYWTNRGEVRMAHGQMWFLRYYVSLHSWHASVV